MIMTLHQLPQPSLTLIVLHNDLVPLAHQQAPRSRMFVAPGAYHELFFESAVIRGAAIKTALDFFTQTR